MDGFELKPGNEFIARNFYAFSEWRSGVETMYYNLDLERDEILFALEEDAEYSYVYKYYVVSENVIRLVNPTTQEEYLFDRQ